MTESRTASQRITEEVTSWPGVEAGPGRRGEFAFRVGSREIGHLHGDRAAHFGFPREIGAELREQGRGGPHPVNPHSPKLAARRIADEADVREVIELLRLAGQRREEEREARLALDRLTRREREVLQALADGLGDKEIAARLVLSVDTARRHMANILGKLGADSRLQALVLAVRHGAVEIR